MAYLREDDNQSSAPVLTSEDIRQNVERVFRGEALSDSLQVKTVNGKARFLGFTLPSDIAALLEYGVTIARPYLNKKGIGFLYDKTSELWKKRGHEATAHAAGLNAARVFTAALIGAEPLSQLVSARTEYSQERTKLLNSISSAIQGSNYKNNEVVSTAFERVHNHAMTNLKKFVADLPVLALTMTYAVWDYKTLQQNKTQEAEAKKLFDKPQDQLHNDILKAQAQYDTTIENEKRKFIEGTKGKVNTLTGKEYTADEISREWEKRENNLYRQFDNAERAKRDLLKNHDAEHDSDKDSTATPVMLVVGGISKLLKSKLGTHPSENKTIALDLILQLKRDLDENSDVSNISERILEVFQQNERDHGRSIMGQKLLPQLMPAIDQIAEVISDGRLNPLALINLVGDGKIVIHPTQGSRRFANEAQTEQAINENLRTLSSRELMKEEEFYANFADPQFIKQTLKNNLAAMKGMEKALFASLFPDDILEQAGVKNKEIQELRKTAHDHMYGFVAASIIEIAQKDPAQLKKGGLSDDDINALKTAAEKITSEGLPAAQALVDGRDKTEIAALRTAGLNEQMATGKNPWAERVKETLGMRQTLEEIAAGEKEKQASKRIGDGMDEVPVASAVTREDKRRKSRDDEPEEVRGV